MSQAVLQGEGDWVVDRQQAVPVTEWVRFGPQVASWMHDPEPRPDCSARTSCDRNCFGVADGQIRVLVTHIGLVHGLDRRDPCEYGHACPRAGL